jgi:SAM-dependent methyltransferase
MDCVKEMVDSIPQEFWRRINIKILDSCCGNGNFHAYIQTKTDLKNLYFNEINEKRIKNVKDYFGKDINITAQDFLQFTQKEEYDLVVSNPPYAKFNENGRTSKNHNLARDFIKKALDITRENGYILFIVPNNWMSFSDRNILPKEILLELRAGYNTRSKKLRFHLNQGLFSELYIFSIEKLKIYFENFKLSGDPFYRLKQEVIR